MKTFTVSGSPTNLRPLLRLAIPALAEEFLVLMVTWTDWWLAGHFFAADGDATKTAMGLMAYVMWLIPSLFATVAIGMTIICSGGVLLYFGGLQIAYCFTGDYVDPTTIQTARLLRIVAFAMPCLAVVMIVSGAFRGAGDTVWPLLFTVIGFFLIRIPLAVWLAFPTFTIPGTELSIDGMGWGIEGAWYAMVADLAVRSVLIGTRFYRGGWKNVKI